MPCALVTGGRGFIGRHLVERLLAEGWQVNLLLRRDDGLPAHWSAPGGPRRFVGALADAAALRSALAGCNVVFHCAANVATWDSRAAYFRDNVEGVAHLLSALEALPVPPRLVHLSTVDVYGYPLLPCAESAPTDGAGFAYGDSKLAGETLLRERAARHGIVYTVLRPGNVIGVGSPFVERIGDALRSGLMLAVDGGRAHAGLLAVDNLVEVMLWAASADAARNRVFNVRDRLDLNWRQVLDRLQAVLGGRVVNLPFALADRLAGGFEAIHRRWLPTREPLLHRLIVRIFGRTCGHRIDALQAAAPQLRLVDPEAVLAEAIRRYAG